MGITLVATFIVCLRSIFTHIGLASTIVIALIEYHAYISLTIGLVSAVTIIALVIIATFTAFKQIMGQVLRGHLLSLFHYTMVIVLNELLIKLMTIVEENLPIAFWIIEHCTFFSLLIGVIKMVWNMNGVNGLVSY